MLRRVADAIYWMARDIERAENVARFLHVNFNLALALGPELEQWAPLPALGHVTLAWGRDYSGVCPVKGLVLGDGQHQLHVAVDVSPIS